MDSFISWIGGKKYLRSEILKRFPEQFDRYVEVFGGAGWVLFGKPPGKFEVFNDINGDLINLYRCLLAHPEEMKRQLLQIPQSREIFFEYKNDCYNHCLTDVQRAARYFYVIRYSFGSDIRTFATAPKQLCVENVINRFDKISERLKSVIIENRDYSHLIKTYDRPETLFYLDPPYVGSEKCYNCSFDKDDHIHLHKILGNIRGKFLLSYNDSEWIRDLYSNFQIDSVARRNILPGNDNSTFYHEILIRNY